LRDRLTLRPPLKKVSARTGHVAMCGRLEARLDRLKAELRIIGGKAVVAGPRHSALTTCCGATEPASILPTTVSSTDAARLHKHERRAAPMKNKFHISDQ
jgi:hypothetical protein